MVSSESFTCKIVSIPVLATFLTTGDLTIWALAAGKRILRSAAQWQLTRDQKTNHLLSAMLKYLVGNPNEPDPMPFVTLEIMTDEVSFTEGCISEAEHELST